MKNYKSTIFKVNFGVSSVYSDGEIEINKKLDQYPELKAKILKHELSHSKGNKYTKKDFYNDFNSKDSHFLQVFAICIKNLEMMIGYFPLMFNYRIKKLTFNSSSIIPLFYFGLIFSLFNLIFKANFFLSFIVWIELVTVINIILLIYTHIYVINH